MSKDALYTIEGNWFCFAIFLLPAIEEAKLKYVKLNNDFHSFI